MTYLKRIAAAAALVSAGVLAATSAGAATIYEGNYNAESVQTGSNQHTVWLPGLFGNQGNAARYWQFDDMGGLFDVAANNATATLTGGIVNNVFADYTMDLQASFTLRNPNVPGTGGPKKGGIKAPLTNDIVDTWSFFDIASATLTGTGLLDGLTLTLKAYPDADTHPFQLGLGANDKDNGLGASGWFHWVAETTDAYEQRVGTPTVYNSGNSPAGSHGDINIQLEAVPLPAGAWMLIAAIAGLGTMRLRRRSA